jgi:hypothetical protein
MTKTSLSGKETGMAIIEKQPEKPSTAKLPRTGSHTFNALHATDGTRASGNHCVLPSID